ncbi:hypothetical protein D779_3145 [Imhoffiella purpurea]|uniref:Uncharacterized protein n=1 Tax=Imhoffiella purpurea TaxID=1249627 RepID=W9VUA9_9GAMM|nr:hypothetical protein D779_3145 [Imhoffiella purpurea]
MPPCGFPSSSSAIVRSEDGFLGGMDSIGRNCGDLNPVRDVRPNLRMRPGVSGACARGLDPGIQPGGVFLSNGPQPAWR